MQMAGGVLGSLLGFVECSFRVSYVAGLLAGISGCLGVVVVC